MNTTRRRVLCVDASEDVRTVEAALLERAGFEVETVGGVSEAMGLSAGGGFDLYLVAYRVSGGTGVEAVPQAARARPSDADHLLVGGRLPRGGGSRARRGRQRLPAQAR